jgi:hypothetical protein
MHASRRAFVATEMTESMDYLNTLSGELRVLSPQELADCVGTKDPKTGCTQTSDIVT